MYQYMYAMLKLQHPAVMIVCIQSILLLINAIRILRNCKCPIVGNVRTWSFSMSRPICSFVSLLHLFFIAKDFHVITSLSTRSREPQHRSKQRVEERARDLGQEATKCRTVQYFLSNLQRQNTRFLSRLFSAETTLALDCQIVGAR